MKAPVIILSALVVLLGFVIYKKGESSSKEIETLTKEQHSLSNQVREVTTRLMLSEATNNTARSNLSYLVERRTSDLNTLSNRIVQTHLLYQNTEKQARTSEEQLQARVARVAVLETELEAARRALAASSNDSSVREVESLRKQLMAVSQERDGLKTQVGVMKVEQADLQSRLFDLEFLDRQRKDAEEAADIRRRMASAREGASPDKRMKLELQADGTVKYVSPPAPATPGQ